MTDMIYGITDTPRKVREWILYALQQVLAVFVATVLIANICGTPVDACLLGACFGTLLYQLITKFRSPMFISSCGATVSAVIGALAIGDGSNYLAVAIGGLVIFGVYALFALIIKWRGIEAINKIFPPIIVGPITMVIGLNLAGFLPTYTSVAGAHSDLAILVAIVTMVVVAVSSHYFKGFARTIPFLIGLGAGYVLAAILTVTGAAPLVDFSQFAHMHLFRLPDFAFLHLNFKALSFGAVGQVLLLFVPVAICALLEHYSDHKVLSNIIGVDLTENPGLHRTLLGDGAASALGTILAGLPNTSYGVSIATTGFSRVASVKVISVAAGTLGILAFIEPVQVLINSIPACVFGGCAMILYGYIAASGLKTLINNKVDLEDNKNLIVVSVILTVGVSGLFLFHSSFAGVSLAMVLGVALNLILRAKK
jgi:uracil permease